MRIRDFSLRVKLALLVGSLVMSLALAMMFFLPARLDDVAREGARLRAEAVSVVLAKALTPGLAYEDHDFVEKGLQNLETVPGAQYAVLYCSDTKILGAWHGDDAPALAVFPEGKHLWFNNSQLHIVTSLTTLAGDKGTLMIGFSLAHLQEAKIQHLIWVATASAIVLVVGLAVSMLIGTLLVRPISTLTEITSTIVQTGDLTRTVDVRAADETGELAASFGQMMSRLQQVLIALKTLMNDLSGAINRLSSVGQAVSLGAKNIRTRVHSATQSADQSLSSLREIANAVEILRTSAEETMSSVIEINATSGTTFDHVEAMFASVETTADAINNMTLNTHEAAQSIATLNTSLTATSAAMTHMNSTIRGIQGSVQEAATLSELAWEHANQGGEAISQTRTGIVEIRKSAELGAEVIGRLEERIHKIDAIVSVITEVARQTNLLSVNAGIIASLAGEHGLGFAVVAGEIRSLSVRTNGSAREIAALIHEIQEESANAVEAMEHSLDRVRIGDRLGLDAELSLQKILSSTRESSTRISQIDAATIKQVLEAKRVTEAMTNISRATSELHDAFKVQVVSAEKIAVNTQTMRLLTEKVRSLTQEQRTGSGMIVGATEKVNAMVQQIHDTQYQENSRVAGVLKLLEEIHSVSEQQTSTLAQLGEVIKTLETQANSLRGELDQFKV